MPTRQSVNDFGNNLFQMLSMLQENSRKKQFESQFAEAMQPVEQNQWMPVQQGQVPYSPEAIQAGGYNQKSMVPPNILQALASVVQKNPSNAPYANQMYQSQTLAGQAAKAPWMNTPRGGLETNMVTGDKIENPFISSMNGATDYNQEFNEDGTPKTIAIPGTNATKLVTSKTVNVNGKKEKITKLATGGTMPVANSGVGAAGGFDSLSQQDKDAWFEKYRTTNLLPPMAFRDALSRNVFTKDYPEYLRRQGITPTQAVVEKAQMDASKSSLAFQQKQYNTMGSFAGNLDKQISTVDKMMKDILQRVGTRAIDIPIRQLKTRFAGSGQERVLESYLMEISREIGKLSTGSTASIAELSVGAQEKWDKIHDPNLSFKELKFVLEATREQARLRLESTKEELGKTKGEMEQLGGNKTNMTPTDAEIDNMTPEELKAYLGVK